MIPRFKPNVGFREFHEIFKKSQTGQVEKFETEFATLTGQSYGLSFTYGRMAILSYLKAENINDKEIICPAFTCVVVAHAIEKSGNRCVFVDINPDDLIMNSTRLKEAISEKTAAIIFTSLYGNPIQVEDIQFVRNIRPEIKIIQDCTHLINHVQEGVSLASLGDVAIYGLGISKPITSIFGGMLTTNNEETFERVKKFQKLFYNKNPYRNFYMRIYLLLVFIGFNNFFYSITRWLDCNDLINYFTRICNFEKIELPEDSYNLISPFEASIGRIQIVKHHEYKKRNLLIANLYRKQIRKDLLPKKFNSDTVLSHYNILVKNRNYLIKKMLDHGFELGKMYDYSLPDLAPYSKHIFFQKNNFAKIVSQEIVNLPMCVSEKQVIKISELVNKYAV